VRAPRGSGGVGQLEAAGLAAGDDEAEGDVEEEEEDAGDDVDEEDVDAGAAGVDAAGLRAVDFAPARASLR
jgi:hypothetical protein